MLDELDWELVGPDLVMSNWARAERGNGLSAARAAELADVGSYAMLNPAALNRKLVGLVGSAYAAFNNEYAGAALNYGNFDGEMRTHLPRTRQSELVIFSGMKLEKLDDLQAILNRGRVKMVIAAVVDPCGLVAPIMRLTGLTLAKRIQLPRQ